MSMQIDIFHDFINIHEPTTQFQFQFFLSLYILLLLQLLIISFITSSLIFKHTNTSFEVFILPMYVSNSKLS
jgi:hypothetical protein